MYSNFHLLNLISQKNHLNICLIALMMSLLVINYGFSKSRKKFKKWDKRKNRNGKENSKCLILLQSKYTKASQMFNFQNLVKKEWLTIFNDYLYWKKDLQNQIWIKMIHTTVVSQMNRIITKKIKLITLANKGLLLICLINKKIKPIHKPWRTCIQR